MVCLYDVILNYILFLEVKLRLFYEHTHTHTLHYLGYNFEIYFVSNQAALKKILVTCFIQIPQVPLMTNVRL